tara:strand:- start:285 stop:509 length:225 start_codon:yes stop_codon:yes gene_type:complete
MKKKDRSNDNDRDRRKKAPPPPFQDKVIQALRNGAANDGDVIDALLKQGVKHKSACEALYEWNCLDERTRSNLV